MQIAIVGTGYVGLVAAACLAEAGHVVSGVDNNPSKVLQLANGVVAMHEPGLTALVTRNIARGRLRFTSDLGRAARGAQLIFLSVGTPSNSDGSPDLAQVMNVARQLGRALNERTTVVVRSTVPVGTTERIEEAIVRELGARGSRIAVDVAFNPEFLREGAAIADFTHPDRVIVGSRSVRALALLRELYAPFLAGPERLLVMRVRDAELAKQAANAMLATRISFMNEMACICERLGVDAESVRVAIGSDPRIGSGFLQPGCGYGGSCLPKDTRALIRTAYEAGFDPAILTAVDLRNRRQKGVLLEKIRRRFGPSLRGLRFALWGLAFKPCTDDMREAPSLSILHALFEAGATVCAHDPEAMATARRVLPDIWIESGRLRLTGQYEAVQDADALLLVTEWSAFRDADLARLKRAMRQRIVFDGRNQYDPLALYNEGFEYFGIGRGTPALARATPDLRLAVSRP
jgi:UDPglucose 6-dehydrogenase